MVTVWHCRLLTNNRLASLGNGTFELLTGLETLKLSKNSLTSLSSHTFTHLHSLKTL